MAILMIVILVLGMLTISGCTSYEKCSNCGSTNVEVVKEYTNHTTGKEMIICNCNNCGHSFQMEK